MKIAQDTVSDKMKNVEWDSQERNWLAEGELTEYVNKTAIIMGFCSLKTNCTFDGMVYKLGSLKRNN